MLIGKLHMGYSTPLIVLFLLVCLWIQCVIVIMLVKLFSTCFLTAHLLNLSFCNFKPFFFVLPHPRLAPRHLLFGFDDGEREIVPPVFSYVLNLAKFFVWMSRNNFRFRDEQPAVRVVLSCVRRRLFFFLTLFAKQFQFERKKRYFKRSWNVIGKFWPNV